MEFKKICYKFKKFKKILKYLLKFKTIQQNLK